MGSQQGSHSSQRGSQRVSIREYARRRGVSDAAVRKWIRAGRIPVHEDGIDPVEADAAVEANRSGSQASKIAQAVEADVQTSAGPQPDLPLRGPSRAEAEAALAATKAERARLALQRDLGEVILVEEAEQAVGEMIDVAKNLLLRIPDDLAKQLAASRDWVECRSILEHGVREALSALEVKLAA